jgi:hypothetical protein
VNKLLWDELTWFFSIPSPVMSQSQFDREAELLALSEADVNKNALLRWASAVRVTRLGMKNYGQTDAG